MLVDVGNLAFWVIIGIAALIILYHFGCFLFSPDFLFSRCHKKNNNRKTIVRLVEPECGNNNRRRKCCKSQQQQRQCFYTVPPPPPPPPPQPSDEDDYGCICYCCYRQSWC